jgi:serine protease Do
VLEDELTGLAEWIRRITVEVGTGRGLHGAGVMWRADGLVVTNAHVAVPGPLEVRLYDGRTMPARLVRRDPARDLAALRIAVSGLPTAEPVAASRVGQLVVAVGHPLGLARAVSLGVVHAPPGEGPDPLARFLRSDVRLAPGNSGGPLADVAGRVLGLNTLVAGTLACAIPSAAVERFLGDAAWSGRAA